jgi:hypothetical protein
VLSDLFYRKTDCFAKTGSGQASKQLIENGGRFLQARLLRASLLPTPVRKTACFVVIVGWSD